MVHTIILIDVMISAMICPPNDCTSPDDPGPRHGSVQSGLMERSDWTDPQTGSLGLDGLGLDRSIYAYNFDIAF
jgi:hypothetical protein